MEQTNNELQQSGLHFVDKYKLYDKLIRREWGNREESVTKENDW